MAAHFEFPEQAGKAGGDTGVSETRGAPLSHSKSFLLLRSGNDDNDVVDVDEALRSHYINPKSLDEHSWELFEAQSVTKVSAPVLLAERTPTYVSCMDTGAYTQHRVYATSKPAFNHVSGAAGGWMDPPSPTKIKGAIQSAAE
ncbi:hypothetical protein KM043_013651 [Ampulex compressa]|nr:hypothetical protein KM043_013651 [Ampulex compressa]